MDNSMVKNEKACRDLKTKNKILSQLSCIVFKPDLIWLHLLKQQQQRNGLYRQQLDQY